MSESKSEAASGATSGSMTELADDLEAETVALEEMLAGLDEDGWDLVTPAEGWLVRDQISHLAFFDEAATRAASDPDRFTTERDMILADPDGLTGIVVEQGRKMTGAQVLEWFGRVRREIIGILRRMAPDDRLEWYGPGMSVASFARARLTATWTYAQDVADVLGIERTPTARLRHVADTAVRSRPHSYRAVRRPAPSEPVRVELTGPLGEQWVWGPEGAANVVRGLALDFCLVVTQRRSSHGMELFTVGSVATEWMSFAQASAGPPGSGARPSE